MSQEYQPNRFYSEITSSRLFPRLPLQPGIPTSHKETSQGLRLINLGESITPFLPKSKALFDYAGTLSTETTFVVDSQLRFPSGRKLPLLPITLSTIGASVSGRIKQEDLKAAGLITPSPKDESAYRILP